MKRIQRFNCSPIADILVLLGLFEGLRITTDRQNSGTLVEIFISKPF